MPDQTTELETAMEWLLSRDTGASSKAILARMLGASARPMDYPHDPGDLGRCLRLLKLIPAWRGRLSEMAVCGETWCALVARWDDLEAAMRGGCDLRVYQLMRSIIDPTERRI